MPAGIAVIRQHPEAVGVATWNVLSIPFLLAGLTAQAAGGSTGLSDLLIGVFAIVWVSALAKTVREGPQAGRRDWV